LRRRRSGRGVCSRFELRPRFGLRQRRGCRPARRRRTRRRRRRCRRTDSRLLDRCRWRRLCDRCCWLHGCDLRRNDFDVQIGHLDPPFLPGKAQARKPALAAEDEAQQQRVNQQREQKRVRQSPALGPRGGGRRVAEAGGAQACPAATSSASDNLIAQPGFVPPQALEVFFEDIQHIVLIPPRLACRVRGDEGVGQVP